MHMKNNTSFLCLVTLCAFFITSEYSTTRPVSSAIFLQHFSVSLLPYAWLISVPFNLGVVTLYNYLLPRWGALRLFCIFNSLVMTISLLCGFFAVSHPLLAFFHYVWKDIYILLMFKQLWSLIHTSVDTTKNRLVYSLLFGIGGVGAILGSSLPSSLAIKLGAHTLFFVTIPLYFLIMLCYGGAYRRSERGVPLNWTKSQWKGFHLIQRSPYLVALLGIVIFMQMAVAFTDFQFNTLLAETIPSTDAKAQYIGRVMGVVNGISLFFQLVGSFFLLKYLGARMSHLLLPLSLGCNAILFLIYPTFGMISYSFVTIKIFDFSIFSIFREMLYSPLEKEEKYHAKALIDVFAYRSAKAMASLVILSLPHIFGIYALSMTSFALLFLFLCWLAVIFFLFKQEKAQALL